jgi:hypothetical protein
MDQGRVPDFFDHWMEEYISKVAADQPEIGHQTPEPKKQDQSRDEKRDALEIGDDKEWRR